MIDIPDYDNLLIPPVIVSDDYWKKRYFYTISNIPLTEEEKSIDFGFYKIHFKTNFFCKENGEILEKEPKLLGIHGLTTITGIATDVERVDHRSHITRNIK
ncbi:Imm26 family immunity protein [Streptococcus suis]